MHEGLQALADEAMVDAHLAGPVADDPFVRLSLPDDWNGADAQVRLGERFDIKGFHRTVLDHGGVTLGILAEVVDRWVSSVAPNLGP